MTDAKQKSLPPRVWVNDVKFSGQFGYTLAFPSPDKLKHPQIEASVEYLSLSEHESALQEAVRLARAEAFEEAVEYLKYQYERCQDGLLVSYHIASEVLRVWAKEREKTAREEGKK